MSIDTSVRKRLLMFFGIFVLVFLACNPFSPVPDDAALNEAGTQVALLLTETALAMPTATSPAQPSPTATEITPLVSSESIIGDLKVDFSFDESLFFQVERLNEPEYFPANVDSSIHYPAYLLFVFSYADEFDDWGYYGIRVWPVERYAAMNSFAASAIVDLQTLLDTRPALELNADFSSLPLPMAALWMSTQAEYLEFQNGSGIRYLEERVQQAYPITNNSLRYRFQGITDDGLYYVSATFIASHFTLPDDGDQYFEESGTNWETFQQQELGSYRMETAQMLAVQSPDSFDPSLLILDEMMQSLVIED